MSDFKYNEPALVQELMDYIDDTYDQHYSRNKFQTTEFVIDSGHGMGFALGNVIKYCQRYGKKAGHNRDDLKKVIHYGIIALAMHDNEHTSTITDGDIFREFDDASDELFDVNIKLENVLKDIQADMQSDNIIKGAFDKPYPGQEPGQD